MAQFTLKRMFASMAVAAIGMAMLVALFRNLEWFAPGIRLLIWFGAGAIIGAGVFAPFKRPWLGVVIGLIVQMVALYISLRNVES